MPKHGFFVCASPVCPCRSQPAGDGSRSTGASLAGKLLQKANTTAACLVVGASLLAMGRSPRGIAYGQAPTKSKRHGCLLGCRSQPAGDGLRSTGASLAGKLLQKANTTAACLVVGASLLAMGRGRRGHRLRASSYRVRNEPLNSDRGDPFNAGTGFRPWP